MKKGLLRPRPSSKGLVFDMPLTGGFLTGGYAVGAKVRDETGGGFDGTATGVLTDIPVPVYPGFDFASASTHYIDIGTGPTSVKTVSLWIKPDGVAGTDTVIDLNGTDFLSIATGTLTQNGFAGGTAVLYTDGVAAATTITAAWHHIAITDTSAKSASDFDIGRETGNYCDGIIAGVRLYSDVLTAVEMKNLYEITKWRYQK